MTQPSQAPPEQLERAAEQLDEMERFAALVGSDDFSAPESVWAHVRLKASDLVT